MASADLDRIIEEVRSLTPADRRRVRDAIAGEDAALPAPLETRLSELSNLGPDWFEPGGGTVDQNAVLLFRTLAADLLAAGLPAPFVYPTPQGDVHAEWSFPQWEVTLVVSGSGSACAHTTHLDSDRGDDIELSLSSPAAIKAITALVVERSK